MEFVASMLYPRRGGIHHPLARQSWDVGCHGEALVGSKATAIYTGIEFSPYFFDIYLYE